MQKEATLTTAPFSTSFLQSTAAVTDKDRFIGFEFLQDVERVQNRTIGIP